MNKEEILAMEAGNDLNVLVATKIFNRNLPTLDQMKMIALEQWKVQPDCIHFFRGFDAWVIDGEFKWKYNEKDYSTDLSAAWEVVEKMKKSNWWIVLNSEGETWSAMFYWDPNQMAIEAISESAPEAICKAALICLLEGN